MRDFQELIELIVMNPVAGILDRYPLSGLERFEPAVFLPLRRP